MTTATRMFIIKVKKDNLEDYCKQLIGEKYIEIEKEKEFLYSFKETLERIKVNGKFFDLSIGFINCKIRFGELGYMPFELCELMRSRKHYRTRVKAMFNYLKEQIPKTKEKIEKMERCLSQSCLDIRNNSYDSIMEEHSDLIEHPRCKDNWGYWEDDD